MVEVKQLLIMCGAYVVFWDKFDKISSAHVEFESFKPEVKAFENATLFGAVSKSLQSGFGAV